MFCNQVAQFALIWWLTKQTGSATVLTTASLAGIAPSILFMLFTGALVDRWNRRLIMIAADCVIAFTTLALVLLFAMDMVAVWVVYLFLFVRSAANGFHNPAWVASTALMVPKQHLTRIQGLTLTLQGLRVVSAPLGALLLAILPIQNILVIETGAALLAVVPLIFVAIPQPEKRYDPSSTERRLPSILSDCYEILRYARAWPGLLLMLLLVGAINLLLTPAMTLLPLLVTEHLGGDAQQLGWLEALWSTGVIVGGIMLSGWGGFSRRIVTKLIGTIGVGLGFSMVGLSPPTLLIPVLAGMFVAGFMNSMTNGPGIAIIQATVSAKMHGRMFSLLQGAAMGASSLGLLIAGPLVELFGVPAWFTVAGLLCALLGTAGFFVPPLMRIETGRDKAGGYVDTLGALQESAQ